MVEIKRDSETPIYLQLKQYILDSVANGEIHPGDRVMSETEVTEKFGISRVTARKAYDQLVAEGYFVRKQGKGTYLRDVCYQEHLTTSQSFTGRCQQMGLKPGTVVVSQGKVVAPSNIAAALCVPEGTEVSYVERLRSVDDIPVRLERNYYAPPYADILEEDLTGSIFKILQQKYGLTQTRQMNFIISIAYTDVRESELLGTKRKTPILAVNGTMYNYDNSPIYSVEMMHLPDRCVLVI